MFAFIELWALSGLFFFWLPLAVILFICVYDESPGWGIFATLAAVAVIFLIAGITPKMAAVWVFANLVKIAWYAGGYVVSAVVWAAVKWFFFNRDALARFNERKAGYQTEYNAKSDDFRANTSFASWVNDRYNPIPSVSNNKGRITTWMLYWPVSIVTTLFGDFLYRFFKAIFEWTSKFYTKVSHMVWRNSGLLE